MNNLNDLYENFFSSVENAGYFIYPKIHKLDKSILYFVAVRKEQIEELNALSTILIQNTAIKELVLSSKYEIETIKIKLTENAIYLDIPMNKYYKLYLSGFYRNPDMDFSNFIKIYRYGDEDQISICFFLDGNVMYKKKKQKNYFPMTFKQVADLKGYSILFSIFFIDWVNWMIQSGYNLYRDILRDVEKYSISAIKCSLRVSELKEYGSYQTLIMGHYKTCKNVPKSVNRMPLCEAVKKSLFVRYVKENEAAKIYQMEYDTDFKGGILVQYYMQKENFVRAIENSLEDYICYIEDYEKMSKYLRQINLNFNSPRKLLDAHNRLINPYMRKKARSHGKSKMKIPENSPFRKLRLPDDFEIIKTSKRLFDEGQIMHHCVYSYLSSVNKGKCCIAHLKFRENHYTIEIGYEKGRFICGQIQGRFNKHVTEDVDEYVRNVLHACSI